MKIVWDQCLIIILLAMSLRLFSSTLLVEANFVNDNDQACSESGTKWAVLVAGSASYENYRHQADVCHAYQILKRGGLKDENIVVFMYDDIAYDFNNPRPGFIINSPYGPDVYDGVPKDYTGSHCTAENFYAALLGNKSALTGGSGKVVNSCPNDSIFIYYADHGAAGFVGMPQGPSVYGKDLVNVIKKKHEAQGYGKMVIYVEACESRSLFEGVLPKDINVYVTTASNAQESSYGTYCPGDAIEPPADFHTCLGDVYSISWMEDSDKMDLRVETLAAQYEAVRRRTADSVLPEESSHVMQYGNVSLNKEFLASYIGFNGDNNGVGFNLRHKSMASDNNHDDIRTTRRSRSSTAVSQRDANLHYLRNKLLHAKSSSEKLIAQKKLDDENGKRKRIDYTINGIGEFLFGSENSQVVMNHVRPAGQPLVDDWECFKMHVKTFEKHCGKLSSYGKKYARALANMCNAGISTDQLIEALNHTCSKIPKT